jgi:hypothetical protein
MSPSESKHKSVNSSLSLMRHFEPDDSAYRNGIDKHNGSNIPPLHSFPKQSQNVNGAVNSHINSNLNPYGSHFNQTFSSQIQPNVYHHYSAHQVMFNEF